MLTAEGEKWFVLRSSVLTRINELDEFDKLRPGTTSDDMSAHVAEEIANDITHDNERQRTTDNIVSAPVVEATTSATPADETRPVATSRDTRDKDDAALTVVTVRMDEREKDLYERVISMQATTIDGLMKDKDELYKLLETANQEKRLLIESDRDTKGIVKNNNSLMAYLSNLFKGRDALEGPVHDAAAAERANLTDPLPGDERA
jgi:hypothetical protein